MISANTRNLIHAISIEGSVAERYFAVTSDSAEKHVEARISAMPLNGRSARAREPCGRRTSSRAKVMEALSSLAAAAGGGVTAISVEGRNIEFGRGSKKRQLAPCDKVRKQDADMR